MASITINYNNLEKKIYYLPYKNLAKEAPTYPLPENSPLVLSNDNNTYKKIEFYCALPNTSTIITLCINMGSPQTTDNNVSIDVMYYKDISKAYRLSLSNFTVGKNYSITIKLIP